jgi:hypothetical protein
LNPDPRIVTVTVPAVSGLGETDVIFGPRLRTFAYATATTCALTTLVARTLTGFCPGSVVGAVYTPIEDIVPPLVASDQVTSLLESPLTIATNGIFPPTTTAGLAGLTVML